MTSLLKLNCSPCTEDVFYKQLQRNHRLLVNHQLKETQEPNWLARCKFEQKVKKNISAWVFHKIEQQKGRTQLAAWQVKIGGRGRVKVVTMSLNMLIPQYDSLRHRALTN